jgi:hypothetical protein
MSLTCCVTSSCPLSKFRLAALTNKAAEPRQNLFITRKQSDWHGIQACLIDSTHAQVDFATEGGFNKFWGSKRGKQFSDAFYTMDGFLE